MMKIFVYNDYDLIEEMELLLHDGTGTWLEETMRYRKGIRNIINVLKKSVDVMIKEDN